MSEDSRHQHQAIRAVAYLEAFKGLLAIAAASGLLLLLHKDIYEIAQGLLEHAHLNPAAKYPSIFLAAAAHTGDTRLLMLAGGTAGYSLLRLIEAYGLFYEKAWAEVLAALSGAFYVPFEVIALLHKPNFLHVVLLLLNLGIVGLMVYALLQRHKAHPTASS